MFESIPNPFRDGNKEVPSDGADLGVGLGVGNEFGTNTFVNQNMKQRDLKSPNENGIF
jgi:hypothetical protein